MTTPELPPLNRMSEGSGWVHDTVVEARERILLDRIAELDRQLEQCRTLLKIGDTDLRLAREQRDWAFTEIKTLRNQLREAGLLDEDDDNAD